MDESQGQRSRLRILTEYFYPEETSTAQLLTALATSLTDEFDVEVVTGYPNYHETDTDVDPPAFEAYEGVAIRRLRGTRFHKERLPLRALNWVTFTVLMSIYLVRHANRDEQHLVLSNPPILPLATWIAKRVRGIEYTYLIYDMYPDMPVGLGYLSGDSMLVRMWQWIMERVYCDADQIVVLGDSMKRRLTKKMEDNDKFDPEKVHVIPNWEDGEFIQPVEKEENRFAHEHDTVEKFTLVYSGNIGRYHDVGTAIDAIEKLEERGRDDIQLLVIGEGGRKEAYQQRVRERNIENVRFLPFQPMDELPCSLTCGDASLVAIEEEMEGMCVSSKLYSSLAAGKPVLAVVGSNDEVARVVRKYDCGGYAEAGDAERVATILERWADSPARAEQLGENARVCFEENYTQEHAVESYTQLFA